MPNLQIILFTLIQLLKEGFLYKKTKGKYGWTVKIGEKGQFVIPKEARELFGINPGDTLIVLADEKRGIAIPPKNVFSELASKIFDESEEDDI